MSAEPEQWRVVAVKLFGVALGGLEEAGQRFQDLQGGQLIDGANIGLAWSVQTRRLAIPPRLGFGRCFFRRRFAAHLLEILHRQTELGQDFLVRNRLVVFQPFIGLVDGVPLGVGQRFVIVGRGCQSAGDGVEQHELQESDGGRNLGGFQPIEQLVCVLFVSSHDVVFPHRNHFRPRVSFPGDRIALRSGSRLDGAVFQIRIDRRQQRGLFAPGQPFDLLQTAQQSAAGPRRGLDGGGFRWLEQLLNRNIQSRSEAQRHLCDKRRRPCS